MVREDRRKIGKAFHLILDPKRGTLVALKTPFGKVVSVVDLGSFRRNIWEVKEDDCFIEESELVRLQEIPFKQRVLIGKKVFTESGDDLGRVDDYALDMETLSLVQLYVSKRFLGWHVLSKNIIYWKDVVEITDQVILVKDKYEANKATISEVVPLKGHERATVPMAQG